MLKTLATIVLTAVTLLVLGESAVAIYQIRTGVEVPLADAVEIGVGWGVIVTWFWVSAVKAIKGGWY
jgi:preprotein translocase subunit SecF